MSLFLIGLNRDLHVLWLVRRLATAAGRQFLTCANACFNWTEFRKRIIYICTFTILRADFSDLEISSERDDQDVLTNYYNIYNSYRGGIRDSPQYSGHQRRPGG